MRKLFISIFITFFSLGCTSEMYDFIEYKNKMEKLLGPCNWNYVGVDTLIEYPAIKLIPPVGKDFVLFNQKCKSELKDEQ